MRDMVREKFDFSTWKKKNYKRDKMSWNKLIGIFFLYFFFAFFMYFLCSFFLCFVCIFISVYILFILRFASARKNEMNWLTTKWNERHRIYRQFFFILRIFLFFCISLHQVEENFSLCFSFFIFKNIHYDRINSIFFFFWDEHTHTLHDADNIIDIWKEAIDVLVWSWSETSTCFYMLENSMFNVSQHFSLPLTDWL